MSDNPSPLKSPVPMMRQLGSPLPPIRPARCERSAVHQPLHDRAVCVLPQDVGLAIAIEVPSGADHAPVRIAGPTDLRLAEAGRIGTAISKPERDRAGARVLPQDVALAVVVEVGPWLGVCAAETCDRHRDLCGTTAGRIAEIVGCGAVRGAGGR